jgi:hypothetical protein
MFIEFDLDESGLNDENKLEVEILSEKAEYEIEIFIIIIKIIVIDVDLLLQR